MPILKAIKPLIYGTIGVLRPGQRDYQTWPGQLFEVDEETALDLESRGLACRYYEPPKAMFVPQNKAIQPEWNKRRK